MILGINSKFHRFFYVPPFRTDHKLQLTSRPSAPVGPVLWVCSPGRWAQRIWDHPVEQQKSVCFQLTYVYPWCLLCYCVLSLGILGDEKTHKYPLYRAYVGISNRGTLVGVHPTIDWNNGRMSFEEKLQNIRFHGSKSQRFRYEKN